MTVTRAVLKLDIVSYWICSSGRGTGYLHDAVPVKDRDGLPYVPGRHLKGLLRDAVSRLGDIDLGGPENAPAEAVADLLFGAPPDGARRLAMPTGLYFGGLLRVSSGTLPSLAKQVILANHRDRIEQVLYSVLRSTSIDRETGVARSKSLRETQVAVPLTLEAEVACDPETLGQFEGRDCGDLVQVVLESWTTILDTALPFLRAVGAHRNRGYGRVVPHLLALDATS